MTVPDYGSSTAALPYDTFKEMYSYYDWFITGANCIVYLASSASDTTMKRQLSNVPVVAVGYQIQQSKSPLYGWNDTGPRMILAGQRIVSGELVILHKECGYFEDILMSKDQMPYGTGDHLSMNESLRLQYWNTRYWEPTMEDPQRAKFKNKKNIFYRHPNFDISIIYGAGDDAGRPVAANGKLDLRNVIKGKSEWYNDDSMQYKDVNPLWRSTQSGIDKSRETIVGVQLNGKSKSIAIDGEIISESYTFIAIDVLNQ
jgi:hypothetical protein